MPSMPIANDPVRSFSQPTRNGPANPPKVPTELIKASTPAAAAPDRNRAGMRQKTARAVVTPMTAIVMPISASQNALSKAAITIPPAPSRQVSSKLTIFVPLRSTMCAQVNIAGAHASANLYSLVETCKANGIDPYRYLTWLFQCSSSLIVRGKGDWSMCNRSAARAKWSSSATAMKQRRCRSSTPIPTKISYRIKTSHALPDLLAAPCSASRTCTG
ncbi:transposase IS66 [Burkholderia stagnalis]|nr:transposase IS66 [Burkholderia stagnalis]